MINILIIFFFLRKALINYKKIVQLIILTKLKEITFVNFDFLVDLFKFIINHSNHIFNNASEIFFSNFNFTSVIILFQQVID